MDQKNVYSEKIDLKNIGQFLAKANSRCSFLGGNHQYEIFVVPPRGGAVRHEEIAESCRIELAPENAYAVYIGSTAIPSYSLFDTDTESLSIVIGRR